MTAKPPSFTLIDHPALAANAARYTTVTVDTQRVVASWRLSLLSYEWLRPDGSIKSPEELKDDDRARRAAVEEKLQRGETIERPLLGIGMLDNAEIGLGRVEFLTLAARGVQAIPVHISTGNLKDFKPFRVGLES